MAHDSEGLALALTSKFVSTTFGANSRCSDPRSNPTKENDVTNPTNELFLCTWLAINMFNPVITSTPDAGSPVTTLQM